MQKAKSLLPNESQYDHFELSELRYDVQWTINKDDSFQLAYVGRIFKWRDGKIKENSGDMDTFLNSVYNNETIFDIKMFQDPKSLKAVQNARQFADLMYRLHHTAE